MLSLAGGWHDYIAPGYYTLNIQNNVNKRKFCFLHSLIYFFPFFSYSYRNFLMKFTYPEIKSMFGHVYDGCHVHKQLANLPPETSCWESGKKYIPVTLYKTFSLYPIRKKKKKRKRKKKSAFFSFFFGFCKGEFLSILYTFDFTWYNWSS
jgi:hypothetical protein